VSGQYGREGEGGGRRPGWGAVLGQVALAAVAAPALRMRGALRDPAVLERVKQALAVSQARVRVRGQQTRAPASAGGTRRVRLVRGDGRGVST
jgi:hypothetical protein